MEVTGKRVQWILGITALETVKDFLYRKSPWELSVVVAVGVECSPQGDNDNNNNDDDWRQSDEDKAKLTKDVVVATVVVSAETNLYR